MCDFILKLNEARRKGISEPIDGNEINEIIPEETTSSVLDGGLKDKSRLFSGFYEAKSNLAEKPTLTMSTLAPEDNDHRYRNSTVVEEMEELEIQVELEDISNEVAEAVKDKNVSSLENSLVLLKESVSCLAKATVDFTSESLNNYHYELSELYNNLVSHCTKKEFLVKQHEQLNVELKLEQEQQKIEDQKKEEELLINKMTSFVSRLSENSSNLNNIKNKMDSLYKNESFSYSTPSEIKAKIKVFGKRLYEVFKVIQKDLNTPVLTEFWNIIQFSKNTKDYKLFREKLNTLINSYDVYYNSINIKYNDLISKKAE